MTARKYKTIRTPAYDRLRFERQVQAERAWHAEMDEPRLKALEEHTRRIQSHPEYRAGD